MIRRITLQDKDFYINCVKNFYGSDAVLHSIPDDFIQKTFDELMHSDTYAICYIFEKENVIFGSIKSTKIIYQDDSANNFNDDENYLIKIFLEANTDKISKPLLINKIKFNKIL